MVLPPRAECLGDPPFPRRPEQGISFCDPRACVLRLEQREERIRQVSFKDVLATDTDVNYFDNGTLEPLTCLPPPILTPAFPVHTSVHTICSKVPEGIEGGAASRARALARPLG